MASTSITSANAIYMLSIGTIFPSPQQLQNFSADNIFTTPAVQATETMMGVDGFLTAGFVFMPVPQTISLMADSDSIDIFDQWYLNQRNNQDVYYADATVFLKSLGKSYTMTKGALTSYPPASTANKVLQPRVFGITWQSITPSNV